MKILLDTHILIWALSGQTSLLESSVADMISDPENIICYSAASIWEVVIKNSIKPGQMGIDSDMLVKLCDAAQYRQLPIIREHALGIPSLQWDGAPFTHKDPFDRLLIAQARIEGMRLVTHDRKLSFYREPCVFLV